MITTTVLLVLLEFVQFLVEVKFESACLVELIDDFVSDIS